MKLVRFAGVEHPEGVYGIVEDDGHIEIIRGGLLDPIKRTGVALR